MRSPPVTALDSCAGLSLSRCQRSSTRRSRLTTSPSSVWTANTCPSSGSAWTESTTTRAPSPMVAPWSPDHTGASQATGARPRRQGRPGDRDGHLRRLVPHGLTRCGRQPHVRSERDSHGISARVRGRRRPGGDRIAALDRAGTPRGPHLRGDRITAGDRRMLAGRAPTEGSPTTRHREKCRRAQARPQRDGVRATIEGPS